MSTAVDLVGAPRRIPNMGRGHFNGIKEGNTAKRDELEKKLRKELEEKEVTSKWEELCSVAKVEDMNVILACLEIEKHRKEEMSKKYEEETEKCKKLEEKVSKLEVDNAVLEDNLSCLVSNFDEERKTFSEWMNEKADLTNQLEQERRKISELPDIFSEHIGRITELMDEKTDLADQLEEERSKVSDLGDKISGCIDTIMDLENEKTDLADQLKEERGKVSELEDNVSEYIDTIANLENEMANLREESWKLEDGEQYGWEDVSECTDMSAKSEKNEADLANQLEKERRKVGELQDRLTVLEDSEHELRKQCAEIQEGKPNVDSNLEDEEWPIVSKSNYKCPENVSELEEKCATLEEDCERKNNTVLVAEKASLQSDKEKLWEMLSQFQADIGAERQRQRDLSRELEDKKAALEEAQRSVRQFEFADEELNKKVSKLEKRCLKLKKEKKVWAAEKESLVMSLNSQASVVEAYRDMLNKEDCLVKLFQNS